MSLSAGGLRITAVTLALVCMTDMALCVNITEVTVPPFVENGTVQTVILDCIYTYDAEEDQHLVVKWFFNDDPKPIYQWIPDLNKRSYSRSRIFEGRIDREYGVPSNLRHGATARYTKYRALKINRPTTEMSGTYSCSVTSLQGQDTESKNMIVYATPRRFTLTYDRPPNSQETQFNCQVESIYPEPRLQMYRVEQTHIGGNDYENVTNMTEFLNYSVEPLGHQRRATNDGYVTVLTTSLSNRHFRLSAQSAKSRRQLFFCVYTIPSTDIKHTRVLVFYPERLTSKAISRQSISVLSLRSMVILIGLLVVW